MGTGPRGNAGCDDGFHGSSEMTSNTVLSEFINKKVAVLTTDGRMYVGLLEGYDHSTNIVIRNTSQRKITEESSSDEPIGLLVIRGDCVAVIGKTDSKLEAKTDWSQIRGTPLRRIR